MGEIELLRRIQSEATALFTTIYSASLAVQEQAIIELEAKVKEWRSIQNGHTMEFASPTASNQDEGPTSSARVTRSARERKPSKRLLDYVCEKKVFSRKSPVDPDKSSTPRRNTNNYVKQSIDSQHQGRSDCNDLPNQPSELDTYSKSPLESDHEKKVNTSLAKSEGQTKMNKSSETMCAIQNEGERTINSTEVSDVELAASSSHVATCCCNQVSEMATNERLSSLCTTQQCTRRGRKAQMFSSLPVKLEPDLDSYDKAGQIHKKSDKKCRRSSKGRKTMKLNACSGAPGKQDKLKGKSFVSVKGKVSKRSGPIKAGKGNTAADCIVVFGYLIPKSAIPKYKEVSPSISMHKEMSSFLTKHCFRKARLSAAMVHFLHEQRLIFPDLPYSAEQCAKYLQFETSREGNRLKYQCPVNNCQFKGHCITETLYHTQTAHSKDMANRCPLCGKDFHRYAILYRHFQSHNKTQSFKCDQCSFSTHMKCLLSNHTKKVHAEAKFECDICGVKLKYFSSLQSHKNSHLGQKPFTCKICNKGFASSSTLGTHQLIHKEKQEMCSLCGRLFINKTKLAQHITIYHTGERKFQCPICQYKSYSKSNLKGHCKNRHDINIVMDRRYLTKLTQQEVKKKEVISETGEITRMNTSEGNEISNSKPLIISQEEDIMEEKCVEVENYEHVELVPVPLEVLTSTCSSSTAVHDEDDPLSPMIPCVLVVQEETQELTILTNQDAANIPCGTIQGGDLSESGTTGQVKTSV